MNNSQISEGTWKVSLFRELLQITVLVFWLFFFDSIFNTVEWINAIEIESNIELSWKFQGTLLS